MTIRIPGPVNRVLDALARHRTATVAVVAALTVSAVAMVKVSVAWDLAFGAVAIAAGFSLRNHTVAALRDERDELQRALGYRDEQLRHVKKGNATAITAQIHQIPEEVDR